MKKLRLLSFALVALPCTHAFSEPVLARVLETSGSVSGAANGGGVVTKGASLGTGANNTGADSQITFTPFPGAVVTYSANTQASIERVDLGRANDAVVRSATFRLQEGTLFFAVDKVNWKTTTFEVLIPEGKVTAKAPEPPKTATAGVVTVRNGKLSLAAEAGNLTLVGSNGTIAVASGSVLSSDGGGYAVTNLTSGQVTAYDAKGGVLGVHMATVAELQAATEIYASATGLTESLIATGMVNSNVATDISQTLLVVNEKLVALGVDPVNSGPVAGLSGGTSAGTGALPALSGAPGASGANPANTSGQIHSLER